MPNSNTQAFTKCVHVFNHYACMVLVSLNKNNLNLPMCSSFLSALCLVASSSCSSCCHAHSLAVLRLFFVCLFSKELILQPSHNLYLVVNLKVGFHSSYFADKKNIIEQVHWVYIQIIPTYNYISRNVSHLQFLQKTFLPVRKLTRIKIG